MTETSLAFIFLDPSDAPRKVSPTGKALMHAEFRIIDEHGADCGPDEVGELWGAGSISATRMTGRPRKLRPEPTLRRAEHLRSGSVVIAAGVTGDGS